MSQDFCSKTSMLLEPITTGEELLFKSPKTGTIYKPQPSRTLMASEESDEVQNVLKYRNTIHTTAFDPTTPKVRIPGGCKQCGAKIFSFQRIGNDKQVVYVCVCGEQIIN